MEFEIENLTPEKMQLDVTYHLFDEKDTLVYVGTTALSQEPAFYSAGKMHLSTSFPPGILNQGIYTIARLLLVQNRGRILTEWNNVLSFEVVAKASGYLGSQGGKEGVIKQMSLPWEIRI